MPSYKMVLWNMEWLNDLFVAEDQPAAFKPDAQVSSEQHTGNATVGQRRADLVAVLNQLAPDVVVIVEGPSRAEELDIFFKQNTLAGTWHSALQKSPDGIQNIGVAVRSDGGKFSATSISQFNTGSMSEFSTFLADTDDDDIEEQYKFERRPLYVELTPQGGGAFRILGLHLKSKGIFTAYEWSKWWQVSDANRRKILAQASQIRLRFLDKYLNDSTTANVPLIVCGDINDGPGLDASEKRLFGSGVERLMGMVWNPPACLRNALFESLSQNDRDKLNFGKLYTTSFRDPIFNGVYQYEWIDHILYTNNVQGQQWVSGGQVHRETPAGDPFWEAFPNGSDHFPVSVTITT